MLSMGEDHLSIAAYRLVLQMRCPETNPESSNATFKIREREREKKVFFHYSRSEHFQCFDSSSGMGTE